MKIIFQYVKMPESDALSSTTKERLDKLSKKYPWLIKAQVFFKKENVNTPKSCVCEIELSAPGPRIFASSRAIHFEPAMKETISDLEIQLDKRKEVIHSH